VHEKQWIGSTTALGMRRGSLRTDRNERMVARYLRKEGTYIHVYVRARVQICVQTRLEIFFAALLMPGFLRGLDFHVCDFHSSRDLSRFHSDTTRTRHAGDRRGCNLFAVFIIRQLCHKRRATGLPSSLPPFLPSLPNRSPRDGSPSTSPPFPVLNASSDRHHSIIS
jgi:hypothetical protein